MSIISSDVSRASLRTSPTSNTEVNVERLPNPKALEEMELRYREERSYSSSKTFVIAFGLVVLCQFYAFVWGMAPGVIKWLWQKCHETEGMPVIGGILGGLTVVIGVCCVVLLPKYFRTALAAISLSMAAADGLRWLGFDHGKTSVVTACAGLLVFWLVVKPAFRAFHNSWSMADPRMTTTQLVAWKAREQRGWNLPTSADAGQIVSRYLTYEALVGFPGVWISPSSLSMRVVSSGFLAGCILALTTRASAIGGGVQIFAAVSSLALSVLAIAAITIWSLGRACWISRECEKQLQGDSRTDFERRLDRLRNSEHVSKDVITGAPIREAEHLFLGFEPWQQFPILIHQPMLGEHVYISGRTGSGKTSMALMLMLIALIRGYRSAADRWSEKSPVIVVDLKGGTTLFQTTKLEAEARGQTFRFFTLEPGKASFHFNPFLAFKSGSLTLPQLVQSLLDACGLYHGDEYGKQYFSERHRNLLTKALESSPNVDDFRKLHRRIKALYGSNPKEFSDGFELVSVIGGLTHYDQLITDAAQEKGNETIRLDRVLADREVVYFWLPTVKESVAANRIAKFVLFCLRAAASDRESAGEPMRQSYLLIDEFQKVAGDNFQGILQQARSAGIAAILANQSLADLKGSTWDLTSTIRTNTRTKLFFSVTEPEEAQAFRELAGEELQTYGVNDVEEIRPRLTLRDLASLSDHPKRLLLHVTSGSGYTQFGGLPIPVQTDWPISKELSDQRAAVPWPNEPKVKAPVPSSAKPSTKKPVSVAPVAQGILSMPQSTTLVPAPIAKAAFAKTIKNLMDE